jgi:lantibiotic transport system permease protein
MTLLLHSFQSEWIKIKRSLALWIVVAGAFFTPAVVIVVRIVHHNTLTAAYTAPDFWKTLWTNIWESMAVFLLPMGTILTTALVAQIEYRNNAWKQLHALPVRTSTIFVSKLAVVMTLILIFFALFNFGIYLAAVVPYLVVPGVPYPQADIPFGNFARQNVDYLVASLPIVALQYLLSLQYRNFLVPIGVGFLLWLAGLACLSWRYGYTMPYAYCIFTYMKNGGQGRLIAPQVNLHILSYAYFIVITTVSYLLFITRKEKG